MNPYYVHSVDRWGNGGQIDRWAVFKRIRPGWQQVGPLRKSRAAAENDLKRFNDDWERYQTAMWNKAHG